MTKKVLHEFLDKGAFDEAVKLRQQNLSAEVAGGMEEASNDLAAKTDDDGVAMTGQGKGKSTATSKPAAKKGDDKGKGSAKK